MLLTIHPANPDARKIAQAVEILRNGGIIVYPTDTLYTFGCDMNNKKALEKVARLKNINPKEANFSLVCYDLSHISEYSHDFSKSVFKMMKATLPGPYTYILKGNKNVTRIFDYKKGTIGIRVPDNNIARALVHELGNPIIATSVHDDSDALREYMTDPEEIYERYYKFVDLVIDGGPGSLQGSTVIDATGDEPELIREGKGEVEIVS